MVRHFGNWDMWLGSLDNVGSRSYGNLIGNLPDPGVVHKFAFGMANAGPLDRQGGDGVVQVPRHGMPALTHPYGRPSLSDI